MDRTTEKIGFLALFFTVMSISSSAHPILLIISYLAHEIGHMFFAKMSKVSIRKMNIGPFRLRLFYDCSFISYKRELLVCAGGILFNLLCFLAFLPFANKTEETYFFSMCNLSLALMNLYPASTLDGGRIFKCIFMMIFDAHLAQKICRVISFIFAFILWLCAVYLLLIFDSNASLFFISIFLLVELCFSA